ncbi:MAG TPA: carbon-nitrogen family hydrolase [Herpetosiphonaceae bacterium]
MELTVAAAQLDLALGDREANLEQARRAAEQAAAAGAQLLILPELWGSGYDLERAAELGDALGEGLFAELAGLARRHRLAICGSLLERRADGVYNTATLHGQDGALLGAYSKTHLIGLMDEDRFLRPGGEAPVIPSPWGPAAQAICYDLRFPELFRRYALGGARLILLPAEWPERRIEHWRTLIRARAIENQCFVVACNRVGSDRANRFGGRSAVIDPWGAALAEAGDEPELLLATLDFALADQARSFLPVFADRRPEVYGSLGE